MNQVDATKVDCPYCGETIEVLIDCSVEQQNYIEDCQVCCRPIGFDVHVDSGGDFFVRVSHEDE
ncbi:MAG: CPXCG motif-containing cysteine-rich protein [Halioglobus sp.]